MQASVIELLTEAATGAGTASVPAAASEVVTGQFTHDDQRASVAVELVAGECYVLVARTLEPVTAAVVVLGERSVEVSGTTIVEAPWCPLGADGAGPARLIVGVRGGIGIAAARLFRR